MYKLSIDIGTTSVKAVLFAEKIRALAMASREYPELVSGIFIEQDPDDWWRCAAECVREVLDKTGVDPKEIRAVGVSGQSPTMLPLGADGRPLMNAVIWLDRRASEETKELTEKLGEEKLHKISGKMMDGYHIAPKLLWLRKNRPEIFAETDVLLQSAGYINYMLTGIKNCCRSDAALTYLYDIEKGDWSDEILHAIGTDRRILPEIFDGYEVIGGVSESAAKVTGLCAGTRVIAGSVDAVAASLEAGLLPEGCAFESTGTASMIRASFDHIVYSPHLSSGIGIRQGTGSLFGEMSGTGASMKWLRDLLSASYPDAGKLTYREMDAMVLRDAPEPTKLIYLPYPAGDRSPIWNSEARAVFFGMDLSTKPADLIRAVMEGTSYALRDNLTVLEEAGIGIRRIRAVGGITNSDIWLRIQASVTGRTIEIPEVSLGAPAGIAMLASEAAGEFPSVEEAMRECVSIRKTVEPEMAWTAYYSEMFRIFKNIYDHTKTDFHDLSVTAGK